MAGFLASSAVQLAARRGGAVLLLLGLVLVLRARLLRARHAEQRLTRWTRLGCAALRVVAADDAIKLAHAKSASISRWMRLTLRAVAARDASDEQRERQQVTRWMRMTLKAHAAREAAERVTVVSRWTRLAARILTAQSLEVLPLTEAVEPAELLCPITGLLFRDPVMILTGTADPHSPVRNTGSRPLMHCCTALRTHVRTHGPSRVLATTSPGQSNGFRSCR